MEKHTAAPWEISYYQEKKLWQIHNLAGSEICSMTTKAIVHDGPESWNPTVFNAELIIKAVNNLEKIIEVLQDINTETAAYGRIDMKTHSRVYSILKELNALK